LSDIRITLPGSETVTLTGLTIDKLIRAGDSEAALLYLYILKTHGRKTASESAIALNKSKGWVASAMATLSRLGLVNIDDSSVTYSEPHVDSSVDATGDALGATPVEASGSASGEAYGGASSGKQLKEPRVYTDYEVKQEIISGSDFAIVIDETQRRLGKQLTEDDMMRLFGIYDSLRLPAEVILQLITHCINESQRSGDGRAPNVRYIEKAAYTWEREGIFTLEKAEEYLKALEERKTARGEIKNAMQIKGRELAEIEKSFVDSWIDMDFGPNEIAIAYDRTIANTGKPALQYMDTIIKKWHKTGLNTVEKIMEKDSRQKRTSTGYGASTGSVTSAGAQGYSAQKHGEPNHEEIERLQRLLEKTRE